MKPNPSAKRQLAAAPIILAAICIPGLDSSVRGAELKPETLLAWDRYVQLTENRIGNELTSGKGFFAHEFGRPDEAKTTRQSVQSGQVIVSRVETEDSRGRSIKIPGGMIHHWRGTVLIPSVRLEQVIQRLRFPDPRVPPQKDVLETRILERDESSLRIYLKLIRKKIVTVAYNTEHLVHYRWHDPFRASSRSIATRIAELEKLHTPQEREKIPGHDRGFLWRLNSYWRYQQVDGGVLVECESLSLSRGYPIIFKPIVAPIVRSIARKSMKRTLASLRRRLLISNGEKEGLEPVSGSRSRGTRLPVTGATHPSPHERWRLGHQTATLPGIWVPERASGENGAANTVSAVGSYYWSVLCCCLRSTTPLTSGR